MIYVPAGNSCTSQIPDRLVSVLPYSMLCSTAGAMPVVPHQMPVCGHTHVFTTCNVFEGLLSTVMAKCINTPVSNRTKILHWDTNFLSFATVKSNWKWNLFITHIVKQRLLTKVPYRIKRKKGRKEGRKRNNKQTNNQSIKETNKSTKHWMGGGGIREALESKSVIQTGFKNMNKRSNSVGQKKIVTQSGAVIENAGWPTGFCSDHV